MSGTRVRHGLIAATVLLLAPLAACSSGGGGDAASTTTKAEASTTAKPTPKTEPAAETTEADTAPETTEAGGDVELADVSLDDLEAALPPASDLGPVWTEVPDDDDGEMDSSVQDALAKQCPDAAQLTEDGLDESESVSRTYEDKDGFQISVRYDRDPRPLADEASVDAMVSALNDCSVDFSQSGFDFTAAYDASRYDDSGAYGIYAASDIDFSSGSMSGAFTTYSWSVITDNGVQVSVTSADQVGNDGTVSAVNADAVRSTVEGFVSVVSVL